MTLFSRNMCNIFFRPNIFLHTDCVIENFKEALNWLPGHLQSSPNAVKKIIVYVHSINACQQIFNWILDELGENIFCGEKALTTKLLTCFMLTQMKTQNRE